MNHRTPDHPLERLVFFSDAVFAIAITLLIIEIHVPELPRGAANIQYWRELGHLLPAFAGFVLSFLVTARFWMTHHAAFAHAPQFAPRLVWPNIQLLMAVVFMPFATAFVTRNIGAFVPTLIYNLTLVVTSALSLRLVRIATASADSQVATPAAELAFLRTRGLAILFASVLALLLGLIIPILSQMALATTPFWLWILKRRALRHSGSARATG